MLKKIMVLNVLVLLLLACGETSNRQEQLQQRMQLLLTAVNDHDAGEVLSYFSANASWRSGWDYERAKKTLYFYFYRYPTIKVSTSGEDIRWISDNEAVLNTTLYALGLSGARLDVRGKSYQVEVRWFFDNGEWQITRLDWQ